ncbi:DUF4279 domain-containing protein [Actinocorallia longicatena]|uniref:DUF4279 domain-containing protein n=1 Tax=Actinocorallia longicatena TaxID=111803 RepID=A0ABP6PW23_9ACTN
MRVTQYAYFALFSDQVSAAEITSRLSLAPDESDILGSEHPHLPSPAFHSWRMVCREPNLRPDEQVIRIITRLQPHTARIAHLAASFRTQSSGGAVLQLVRYLNDNDSAPHPPGFHPLGFHLDNTVMAFLHTTGAALDVNEYDLSEGY